ncbi:MAG: 3'(2'),5'-bisphosphate nucleotidase CysQ [Planctomycetes bacterium]|nr:3'(2'),5'-bisphosphate nucleotidase CysQ [Planctomycetota bacterium]
MSINRLNILDVIRIAKTAGDEILNVYTTDFCIEAKEDQSPLTIADKNSNDVIVDNLKTLYPDIPILSEEGKSIPYEERKIWEYFWLVDPLDGTKEFIKRNGEFTVNIALIHKNKPVIGVIYVPVKGLLYFAQEEIGTYKFEGKDNLDNFNTIDELTVSSQKLPGNTEKMPFTIVGSRSHWSKETEDYIHELKQKYKEINIISAGSSLKFCLVAEAKANVYPRFGPTMEWDTAAGHIIVEEAGGQVIDRKTNLSLKYNKENLLNPWFLVER